MSNARKPDPTFELADHQVPAKRQVRAVPEPEVEIQVAAPRRAPSVPLALLPAIVLMTVAATLLVGRLAIPDWQGLITETWSSASTTQTLPVAQNEPNPAPETLPQAPAQNEPNGLAPVAQNEPNDPTLLAQNEPNPAPETLPQAPVQDEPNGLAPVAQNEPNDPTLLAQNEPNPAPETLPRAPAQNEPNDPDTAAAVDDINREAERKKQELQELEKLRKEAEARADARPRRQPDPFAPLNRQDRELWLRQQREIERQMLEHMARAQQEFQKRFEEMGRTPFARPRPWPPAPPIPRPPIDDEPAPRKPAARSIDNFTFRDGRGQVETFTGPGNTQGFILRFSNLPDGL